MPAPMLGPAFPSHFRFALGDMEVTTILDGAQLRPSLNPPFAMDKDAAELAAIGTAWHLPSDCFVNSFIPVVVNTGTELVLFDTGFGPGGRGDGPTKGAGLLRQRLGEAGYAPEDIDVVAFTHMHPDHIAGVMEGDALAYPNARHVIGRREFDEWKSGTNIPAQREKNREMFLRLIAPLEDRLTYVEDGDAVATGITAEAAFGHSLGHMMYRVESAGKSVLIWGDVTNHYVFSLAYPHSPVGFDDDKAQAKETRLRVLDMVAAEGTLVIGHHMPFPGVGHVQRQGDGFRWQPVSYHLML